MSKKNLESEEQPCKNILYNNSINDKNITITTNN